MKKAILCLILASIILSCRESGESLIFNGQFYELSELYGQKIPNSPKILYEFDAWSKYNDSHVFGFTVFDSTESVSMSKINAKLPFSYLEDLPTKESIKGIRFIKAKEKFDVRAEPIKEYSINREEINIDVKELEHYVGYSTVPCYLQEYEFESFAETSDSIFLSGISTRWQNLPQLEEAVGFKKGNVKLIGNGEGRLLKIIIEKLVKETGDLYKYKYGTNEIEDTIRNKPVICVRTYYFNAKNAIDLNEFSDYGIFKEVR